MTGLILKIYARTRPSSGMFSKESIGDAAFKAGLGTELVKPRSMLHMHLDSLRLADFEPLIGPPPLPHGIPMAAYPLPVSGRDWAEGLRSRQLPG